ncbi:NRPS [Arachnomyces sp. PD_36]|nr:NRPS [Arachnomyces sp. PD_36]
MASENGVVGSGPFQAENLQDMVLSTSTSSVVERRIFETADDPVSHEATLREVAEQCRCSLDDLEDVYQCTALQEGMMAITLKDPMAYTVEYVYRLPSDVDLVRFQDAWDQTIRANPILRTRIVPIRRHGCVQAVVRGSVPWRVEDNESTASTGGLWRVGAPLVHFTLYSDHDGRYGLRVLVHHALCDDWSMALLLKQVEEAYRGQKLIYRPFRPLIEYMWRMRAKADVFWANEFEDAHESDMKAFPSLPAAGYVPHPTETRNHTVQFGFGQGEAGFTVNTKVRLAWAILQAYYTGSADTLFGAIDAGRGLPLAGIEALSGPTLVCLPVRIALNPDDTVTKALETVQQQWASALEVEHVGLQKLLHLGPGPAAACQFQTLVAVEPREAHSIPDLFDGHEVVQKAYDTYPLILRCRPSTESMTMEARFDPVVIDPRQTERILHQLSHIYELIDNVPDKSLRDLNMMCAEDKLELSRWNQPVPPAAAQTMHSVFHDRVRLQPRAPAISSWDGELTYDALDGLSSSLSVSLIQRGVKPGVFVPLCVEKSKWLVVAMLGVMKAGGAFVLLDSSYPIQRLRKMCEQVDARLIVTSQRKSGVAAQLPGDVLVVERFSQQEKLMNGNMAMYKSSSAAVSPDDPLYVTFTSGSTGTPKGVLVHHNGFATSALAHGKLYGFTPKSRVLQFASPAFDSCIIEHLSTLIMGGCVCVPPDEDCHSALADTINRYNVNIACLTPTVTRILDPETLPGLEALAFVGEAVLASDVSRWESHVHVRNAYGPAECSAVFSVQPILQAKDPANIGFPTGAVGWVVHPEDHDRLMPVGCAGELLIEGPIVGLGYLSNPQLSDEVFIEPPPWREEFGLSSGSMYKTGDLVQCVGDGMFRYLGRKDTQVKLHGQRMELADVEYHLRRAFPQSPQAVAEILKTQGLLVAFICLPGDTTSSTSTLDQESAPLLSSPSKEFQARCATAESQLSNVLPSFMVPNAYLPISRVPLTPSGKTNRRYLRECAAALSWDELQAYRGPQSESRRPLNSREKLLQQIWAQILNRNEDQIGVTQSFLRLGGDSVSAMQVAASCQSSGFKVTVADIFKFSTIAELAEKLEDYRNNSYRVASGSEDPTDTWFGLSPVQQLFFKHTPHGHNEFTQQFLLQVSRPKPTHEIQGAIRAIVDQHSMLRAYFQVRPNGKWEQAVSPQGSNSYLVREHLISSIETDSLRSILTESQEKLNVQSGLVMIVDLFTTGTGQQYLSLMIHHLVIDLVSWRVLLQDLEEILTGGAVTGVPSVSFQHWCHLQQAYSSNFLDPRTAYPVNIPPPALDYWGPLAVQSDNTWGETEKLCIFVDERTTKLILGSSNDAFNTRPVEIIQAAILHAFVRTFNDRPEPTIFSEGHGREPWDEDIDISRTVGWFTTMAPLFVKSQEDNDIVKLLQGVKDGRRSIPSNGWAYFSSRHLHPDGEEAFPNHAPMEILFNYTGLFQQLERSDALLQLATLPDHDIVPIPSDLPRFALIDVSATVMNGQLQVAFWYNRQMQHQDKLSQWIKECEVSLCQLPNILQEQRGYTMSDFPLLSLTKDSQLQGLVHQISKQCQVPPSHIEDIYPCSPVQLGMWLSQIKNPEMYWSHMEWSVYPMSSTSPAVDANQIQRSWQRVVNRHPILRTVFIDYQGCPVQVVLKSVSAKMRRVSSETPTNGHLPSAFGTGETSRTPAHQFSFNFQADGGISCELTIHHTLMDGVTRQVLLSDFRKAYDDQLSSTPGTPYSSFIGYIQSKDGTEAENYWKKYLGGVYPCHFPRLGTTDVELQTLHAASLAFDCKNALQSFCQTNAITVSNFFQVAWGLVLRIYTGSDSVCFGYLTSGRQIALEGAHDIAGPLINLLVCRLLLADEDSVVSTLVNNQAAYALSLDNQDCALANVMSSLNLSGQSLFNTAMSLQRVNSDSAQNDGSSIKLGNMGGEDSTEYDLTVNLQIDDNGISGDLTYWTHAISDVQAELISDTFQHVVMQLLSQRDGHIGQLSFFGPKNEQQVFALNREVPKPVVSSIHKTIREYSVNHQNAPAVCSWDGSFTYGELDSISSSLGLYLIQNGVGPEVFVPVCTSKSRWTVVSVLAILKAGGAFILLDPSHPLERLQDMIHKDFNCPLILASKNQSELAANIADHVIIIDDGAQSWDVALPLDIIPFIPTSPTEAAYAVFTSGSTGKPKASVIEHQSFLSAARTHIRMLDLGETSRVLQFASYAFDASIVEIFSTLLSGGCVCIPSDVDRQQRLSFIIQELQVNWTLLTPSVARILDPQNIPSLKTLVLGGEGMSRADVQKWAPHVHLINAYGPSECSVIATIQTSSDALLLEPADIGRASGGVVWVVNPHDPNQLTPPGAVGELLIEGPIVGRGYVNRPEQMAASFLDNSRWLRTIREYHRGLVYRTGDLVRLLPDGTVRYVGRKDRQVKLNGQRIELAEVEYHVQKYFQGALEVFADVVKPEGSETAYLISSVHISEIDGNVDFQAAAEEARDFLRAEVPAFLIPAIFAPLYQLPRMLNGKVDRRRVRQDASEALQAQMDGTKKVTKAVLDVDLSPAEYKLRNLWSKVLRIPAEAIGPEDHFFRLGGDSIAVMKLASCAGAEGLELTVAEVFLNPRLSDLAQINSESDDFSSSFDDVADDVIPFMLLPAEQRIEAQAQAMAQCGISLDQIEDIYPCTPLQIGLAAITVERPGAYVAQHEFRLPGDIDISRLREAWERVFEAHPILRTRLIQTVDLGSLQVVIRDEQPYWRKDHTRQENERDHQVFFGQRLVELDIVRSASGGGDNGDYNLTLAMHHTVYDAWSLPRIIEVVRSAYLSDSEVARSIPFQHFIRYTNSQLEKGLDRWRSEFQNLAATPFPTLPSPSYRPRALGYKECSAHTGPFIGRSVTRSTATWLSWALVQAQYQSSQEVIFGVVSTGRRAPVRGIETMSGPTFTTLPLKVMLNANDSIAQALDNLQEWSVRVISMEQTGLHRIAKLSPEAAQACSFQTLLNVEVPEEGEVDILQQTNTTAERGAFSTYALELVCKLEPEDIIIEATFDENVIPSWQVQCILDQFSHVLQVVHQKPHQLVREIPLLNSRSIEQLQIWNPDISPLIPETVSEMIYQRYATQPSSPAVCSWDGDFTYGELEMFSNKLVTLLLSHNIGSNALVPIYMERCRWTIIAILGVVHTGATFVLLDTSYPLSRLQTICHDIQASIILTSEQNMATAETLVPTAIAVGADTGMDKFAQADRSHSPVDPHQALYTVFTSGSTGKPKGVVIENGSFVTMALPYAQEMVLNDTSRLLQFASYAFDVSILEMLGTLMVGACICLLSESERREGISQAVARMQPTHAMFTPSLLRALRPSDLPSVRTVVLTGEPARKGDIQQWADKVRLMNCYGPAEATVYFTMQPSINRDSSATNIGFPIAGNAWVAHPRDPHQPVPIGAVGELLLQGPLVGRGYLNDMDQTAIAFIHSPKWVQQLISGYDVGANRVYRTGDLVRYEADGSLFYVGRRDFQVKLRGQRFELGEVEENIQRQFNGTLRDVIAEIVTPAGPRKAPCLVAFIVPYGMENAPASPSQSPPNLALDTVSPPGFEAKIAAVKSKLYDALPDYMVPSAFVPLRQMPQTTGGKVDRRRLRDAASAVTIQQLEFLTPVSTANKPAISSEAERMLQDIWARALGIPPAQIGADESFFRLGGDSISALQATSQARAIGIEHSVADLFRWKSIREVARRSAQSLTAKSKIASKNAVDKSLESKALGVYSCTPTQRAILLNQVQDPTSYAPQFMWRVDMSLSTGNVDVNRLAQAWEQVVARHPALRTVFRPAQSHDDYFEQVLLKQVEPSITILPEVVQENPQFRPTVTNHGQTPHHFTIYTTTSGQVMCRLDINHTVIDAMSISVVENDLARAYSGLKLLDHGDAYSKYLYLVQQEPQEPAHTYWASYLTGILPSSLPASRGTTANNESPDSIQQLDISLSHNRSDIESCRWTDWTASNIFYFAWALTLSAFTGATDVCFGTLTSGRHFPVPNLDDAVGQFSNMSICRVNLAPQSTLDQAALRLQEHYGHVLAYQTFPLAQIARAAGVTMEELASTAINVQYTPATEVSGEEETPLQLTPVEGYDPTLQDIVLYVLMKANGELQVSMTYRLSRISAYLASQLAEYFDLAISAILQHPRGKVDDLSMLSITDKQRLRRWNPHLPDPTRACVHEIIERRAIDQPHHIAVSGSDGQFTYKQLDRYSSQVAGYLIARGCKVGQCVPVCFERSRWTAVAMVAVMKAGGTFVPLEHTHPLSRLREICSRTHASLILSSVAQTALSKSISEEVITVGDEIMSGSNGRIIPRSYRKVDPEQAAYVLFTSGTTGAPKGVMIPHSSYTSAAETHIRAFSFRPQSRVLQFSSYSFDVSVMEILTTLMAGATVCVITEEERSQMLSEGVCPVNVTHAFITPSVAGIMDPSRASWVQTLILLGEAVSASHIAQWHGACNLVNAYGPTECSVINIVRTGLSPDLDAGNIGWPLGIHCWVVDKDDHEKLLPVGSVGELALSGPSVGRGYLDQPDREVEGFLDPPKWLSDIYPGTTSSWRFYKTGDLVRYVISDGSIRFEGRKDQQIKVRGMRVELEEIEYHSRRCFPDAREVVVCQVAVPEKSSSTTANATSIPRLVACVWKGSHYREAETNGINGHDGHIHGLLGSANRQFHADTAAALTQLRDALPGYMVPHMFLPITRVPRTKAGKTDRGTLKEELSSLKQEQWNAFSDMKQSKTPLESETEVKFHSILTEVLELAPDEVGAEDSFYHLGGDSILAMKVAAQARDEGLEISAHDILRTPTIRQWAEIIHRAPELTSGTVNAYTPFSLVTDDEYAAVVKLREPAITPENVADVLPALEAQVYYIRDASPLSYVHLFPAALSVDRLHRACSQVLSRYSILRTVFVTANDQMFQVILRDVEPVFHLVEDEDPEAYMANMSRQKLSPNTAQGSILVQFTIVTSRIRPDWVFIASISHAQYDGSCLAIFWEAIVAAYEGREMPDAIEFTHLVQHRLGNDHPDTLSFWKDYLKGVSLTAIDPLNTRHLPGPLDRDTPPRRSTKEMARPYVLPEITMANFVKAALAWLLSQHSGLLDLIIGQVFHGRGGSFPGVEKVLGPCISFLPTRILINPSWTVAELLRQVQAQQLTILPYDEMPLSKIAKQCTSWPEDVNFGIIVHHQSVQPPSPLEIDGVVSTSSASWGTSRALPGQVSVFSVERENGLDLMIAAPVDVLSQRAADLLASRLAEMIGLFSRSLNSTLSSLNKVEASFLDHQSGAPNSLKQIPTLN